jgi:23S rRNA (uracil1939-C5)-methyltransferase
MELYLEKWVNNGYCIAYKNDHVYFVKGGLPGETVEVYLSKQTTNHSFGEVTNAISPSDQRIESDCISYPSCGGCSFRHIEYKNELEIKTKLFKEEFIFHGIEFSFEDSDNFSIYSGNENHYRNTVQIQKNNDSIGFFKSNSNQIVPFPTHGCRLLAPELNKAIHSKKKFSKKHKFRWNGLRVVEYENKSIDFKLLNKTISIPEDGFFQINQTLIEKWILVIQKLCIGKTCIEFFCGSGLITSFIANNFSSYAAYEISKNSLVYAQKNLDYEAQNKVIFYEMDLYKSNLKIQNSFDFCLANPPRAGLGNQIINYLINFTPNYLLYSSCNYITLVRDLKLLRNSYKIESIHILDFFPRTPYFESIVLLKKMKLD